MRMMTKNDLRTGLGHSPAKLDPMRRRRGLKLRVHVQTDDLYISRGISRFEIGGNIG